MLTGLKYQLELFWLSLGFSLAYRYQVIRRTLSRE